MSSSQASGCDDDSCTSQTNVQFESDTQEAPFLGWFVVGALGAGRRRRHQLNKYDYSTGDPFITT